MEFDDNAGYTVQQGVLNINVPGFGRVSRFYSSIYDATNVMEQILFRINTDGLEKTQNDIQGLRGLIDQAVNVYTNVKDLPPSMCYKWEQIINKLKSLDSRYSSIEMRDCKDETSKFLGKLKIRKRADIDNWSLNPTAAEVFLSKLLTSGSRDIHSALGRDKDHLDNLKRNFTGKDKTEVEKILNGKYYLEQKNFPFDEKRENAVEMTPWFLLWLGVDIDVNEKQKMWVSQGTFTELVNFFT
jgi:hypothetical protein